MDMGKAFTYLFDDESWLMKILIGGALSASFEPVVQL